MFYSKIIPLPSFSPIPGTEAANVNENIDNWLSRELSNKIALFTRPSEKGYKGYRFVNCDDFKEEMEIVQVILGVVVTIHFTRLVHTPDASFCPLWFTLWRYDVEVRIEDGEPFKFKSDNDLKKRIREYKHTSL